MTKYLDRADYGHDRSIFDCGAPAGPYALQRAISQWIMSPPDTKAERKAERRVLAALDTIARTAGYRKPRHPSLVWAEVAPSSPPLAQNDAELRRVTPRVCEAVSEAQEPECLPAWELVLLGADIPDGDPEGLHTLRCGDLDPDLAQKVLDHYRAERACAKSKSAVIADTAALNRLRAEVDAAEARHA